ncbi:MAG: hypothetical protein EUB_03474 [Eubacterium sp.]
MLIFCGASAHGIIERYWVDAQGNGFYLAGSCVTLSEKEIESLNNREALEKLIMDKAFIGIRRVNNHITEGEDCLKNFEKIELSDYQKNPWKSGHWARLCQYKNTLDTNYIDIWIYTDGPIPPGLIEDSAQENGGGTQDPIENIPNTSAYDSTISDGQQNLTEMVPAAVTSVISNLSETAQKFENDVKEKPQISLAKGLPDREKIQATASDKTSGRDSLLLEKAAWTAFFTALLLNLCLGFNLIKDFKILHWYKEKKKEHLRKEGNHSGKYDAYLSVDSHLSYRSGAQNPYGKKIT